MDPNFVDLARNLTVRDRQLARNLLNDVASLVTSSDSVSPITRILQLISDMPILSGSSEALVDLINNLITRDRQMTLNLLHNITSLLRSSESASPDTNLLGLISDIPVLSGSSEPLVNLITNLTTQDRQLALGLLNNVTSLLHSLDSTSHTARLLQFITDIPALSESPELLVNLMNNLTTGDRQMVVNLLVNVASLLRSSDSMLLDTHLMQLISDLPALSGSSEPLIDFINNLTTQDRQMALDLLNDVASLLSSNGRDSNAIQSFLEFVSSLPDHRNENRALFTEIRNAFTNNNNSVNHTRELQYFLNVFSRLDNSSVNTIEDGKRLQLLNLFRSVYQTLNETRRLNETVTLFRDITNTLQQSWQSPNSSPDSILEDVSQLLHGKLLASTESSQNTSEEVVLLNFISKLRVISNISRQISTVRQKLQDMLRRVSNTYNTSMAAILQDMMQLNREDQVEEEARLPLVEFLQKYLVPDQSDRFSAASNSILLRQMLHTVHGNFTPNGFADFVDSISQLVSNFERTPNASVSFSLMLISLMKNLSHDHQFGSDAASWLRLVHLISNSSSKAAQNLVQMYASILQFRNNTSSVPSDLTPEQLLNIISNISKKNDIGQEVFHWQEVYHTFSNMSGIEDFNLKELFEHLFGRVSNETTSSLTNRIILDLILSLYNVSQMSSQDILHWTRMFENIQKASRGNLTSAIHLIIAMINHAFGQPETPETKPTVEPDTEGPTRLVEFLQRLFSLESDTADDQSLQDTFLEILQNVQRNEEETNPHE